MSRLGSGSTIQITSCAVSLCVSVMEAFAQLPFSSSGFQSVSHVIASGVFVVMDMSYLEPAQNTRADAPTRCCVRNSPGIIAGLTECHSYTFNKEVQLRCAPLEGKWSSSVTPYSSQQVLTWH